MEEADLDKKQDENQTEDAGNVKEDQTEESEKVDNSSDKSDNQNSIEAETKPNLENNSENNSENNLENNSEEKDIETTGKNSGTTVCMNAKSRWYFFSSEFFWRTTINSYVMAIVRNSFEKTISGKRKAKSFISVVHVWLF